MRAALVFLLLAHAVYAQTRFSMRWVSEIGHLVSDEAHTSANLGIATAHAEEEFGTVRLEGRDTLGKRWRVWLEVAGGVGGTDVWTADFDRNGRADLLIAASLPGNGRCVQTAELTLLMFDAMGRPVPWQGTSSSMTGFRQPPVPLVDADKDGRAEMVTLGCEYDGPGAAKHSLSGVYAARDAAWHPVRSTPSPAHAAAGRWPLRGTSIWLAPSNAAAWPDFLEGWGQRPLRQLRSLSTGDSGDHATYADGTTHEDWPAVVIDASDGRDVFLKAGDTALLNVLRLGYSVRVLGNAASPKLLWADSHEGANVAHITATLRVRRIHSSGSAEFGTWFSDGGPHCYHLYGAVAARITEGCPAIDRIRRMGASQGSLRVRESMAWQVIPQENRVRRIRSMDGGEMSSTVLQPVSGQPPARVIGAVEFGNYWMAEWQQANGQRWLALHLESGEPLTGALRSPFNNATLAENLSHAGLRFLRWNGATPAEVITTTAAVEWSRTRE